MNAGRDLDIRIAKIMGLKNIGWWLSGEMRYGEEHIAAVVPYYSTDIAAAFTLAEHLGCAFRLVRCVGGWRCTFDDTVWKEGQGWDAKALHDKSQAVFVSEAFAETAPLAICLAALKVKEEQCPHGSSKPHDKSRMTC